MTSINTIASNLSASIKLFRSKFDDRLLADLSGWQNTLPQSVLDSVNENNVDKAIQLQHNIELSLDPKTLETMTALENYLDELFLSPDFRVEPGEDGELKDKDVEQLNELKNFIQSEIRRKIKLLKIKV